METATAADEDQNGGQIPGFKVRPYTESYVFDKVSKKPRVDDAQDMRRVAEIVMVLSAASIIRGGRSPSTAEMQLMAEAREKLVDMCGSLAPKDLLGRDAIRVVLEDLGLNRLKDQRLGFRPPKVSIAEKLALTKRKMEESREIIVQAPPCSPHVLPVATATNRNVDGHGTTFCNGGTQSNMQPQPAVIVMSEPSSSSLANDPHSFPLPRTEAAHFILDPQSNEPSYMLQVRAGSSSVNMEVRSETSSPVPSSAIARTCESFKAPDHSPLLSKEVQEPNNFQVAQPAREHNPNAFAVQTASVQGLTFGLPAQSSYSNHIDIARTVQKILQSRVPDHHKWAPPLIDYMNKPLMCQVCKLSISDIETLLVCDSCEKGTHLQCLHTFNQRSIPKGEWHCSKCLIISNGRPLPPKYGRVSRNVGVPKVSISSTDKKIEHTDQNDNNLQKVLAFGNSSPLNPVSATNIARNPVESILKVPSVREEQVISPSQVTFIDGDGKICRNSLNSRDEELSVSAVALDGSQEELVLDDKLSLCDAKIIDYATVSNVKVQSENLFGRSSEIGVSHGDKSQTFCNSQEGYKFEMEPGTTDTKKQSFEATENEYEELKESKKLTDIGKCVEVYPKCDIEGVRQDGSHVVTDVKLDIVSGTYDCNESSSVALHEVDWIGRPLEVVDEKTYYESCYINGMVYKLKDYVLLASNGHELYPSKIQVLWEDNKTKTKWAVLSKCFFPGDMHESVGRPSTPEKDEVYESNHESTALVGLVCGPCQVLSQKKFLGECEKRRQESNSGLKPVFLCKWFYDELKVLFRPVID